MLSEDIAAAHSFLHFSMHRPCSVHLSYCGHITDEALIGVCWHRARASTSSLFRSAWHDWAKFCHWLWVHSVVLCYSPLGVLSLRT